MEVLKIETSAKEPIVTVHSNLDGTFYVEAKNREDQEYFSELINKISKENPVLSLISGEEKIQDGKIVNRTFKAEVKNTDINCLSALWDYFNKTKDNIYKGYHFYVHTTDEDSEKEKQIELNKEFAGLIYNLYLNIPGFPKLTPEETRNFKRVGGYFLTGPEVVHGKISIPEFIKQKMAEEGKVFDPTKHILIHIPIKIVLSGAPKILVIELPRPIVN